MKKNVLLVILVTLLIPYLSHADNHKSKDVIKVTTLIENSCISSRDDLTSEHGVSIHIQFGEKNILFDTGGSDNFIKNASKLNVDISEVDILVISHANRDHGGGLSHFLKVNSKAKVYMHVNAKKEYYYNEYYIGLDNKLLTKFENRITYISDYTEIIPGASLLALFDNKYLKPQNRNLYMKDNTTVIPDNMEHEIVLVLKRNDELVVFSGCSHNGILNMTEAALKQFPEHSVLAVLGGFHLMNPGTGKMAESEETVKNIAESFQRLPVKRIYSGHCTGNEAFNNLKKVLEQKLEPFRTGGVFEI